MAEEPEAQGERTTEKAVFGITADDKGVASIIVICPEALLEQFKQQRFAHFDFGRVGIPVRLVISGAKDRKAAEKIITDLNSAQGFATLKTPGVDYGIAGVGDTPTKPPKA